MGSQKNIGGIATSALWSTVVIFDPTLGMDWIENNGYSLILSFVIPLLCAMVRHYLICFGFAFVCFYFLLFFSSFHLSHVLSS